jgi:hypothetical protein
MADKIDLNELERVAREATPGPWTPVEHSWANTSVYAGDAPVTCLSIDYEATEETQDALSAVVAANAAHIAAWSPDIALQVVAALRAAQALLAVKDSHAEMARINPKWLENHAYAAQRTKAIAALREALEPFSMKEPK